MGTTCQIQLISSLALIATVVSGCAGNCLDDGVFQESPGDCDADEATTEPIDAASTGRESTSSSTADDSSTSATSAADTSSSTSDSTTGNGETTTTESGDDTGVAVEGTYLRFDTVEIRDPHIFHPSNPTQDVTALVNPLMSATFTDDTDENGVIDNSCVIGFIPLDQSDAATGAFMAVAGECTAPAETSTCSLPDTMTPEEGTYTVAERGTCYTPDNTYLSTYAAPPAAPTTTDGPCFRAELGALTFEAASIVLPIENAVVAGQFVGDPANRIVQGSIEGFVSAEAAAETMFDTGIESIPVVAMSSVLRTEDQDLNGTGWVFHIAFTAEIVPWEG